MFRRKVFYPHKRGRKTEGLLRIISLGYNTHLFQYNHLLLTAANPSNINPVHWPEWGWKQDSCSCGQEKQGKPFESFEGEGSIFKRSILYFLLAVARLQFNKNTKTLILKFFFTSPWFLCNNISLKKVNIDLGELRGNGVVYILIRTERNKQAHLVMRWW